MGVINQNSEYPFSHPKGVIKEEEVQCQVLANQRSWLKMR